MADYSVLGVSYNHLLMAISTVTMRGVVGGTVGEKQFWHASRSPLAVFVSVIVAVKQGVSVIFDKVYPRLEAGLVVLPFRR